MIIDQQRNYDKDFGQTFKRGIHIANITDICLDYLRCVPIMRKRNPDVLPIKTNIEPDYSPHTASIWIHEFGYTKYNMSAV